MNTAVLIGYDKYFSSILSQIPGCLLLDKSMSTIMLNSRIKPCKEKGGIVFINDEEGVNDLEETPAALDVRADANAVKYIDKYLAWGRDDAEFFAARKPGIKNKINIVGSHRYDLLNAIGKNLYRKDIESLTTIFGNFVLFNDNLAVDHYDKSYSPPTHQFAIDSEQATQAKNEWSNLSSEHTSRRIRVRDFILDLSRYGINILVRPHPVYDPLFWHESFRLIPNINTIYKGSVEPWIHSASAVITTGCTTGLQALLADTPSFELPIAKDSKAFSSYLLPKCTSASCFSPDALGSIKSTLPMLKKRLQDRWFHGNSTTKLMSNLILESLYTLPDISDFSWLAKIVSLKPQAPKWRMISSNEVSRRFSTIKNILNLEDNVKCKKVANSLYIVYQE